jgi:ATP-binding cassette subfamily B protein
MTSGELISRLSDTAKVRDAVSQAILTILLDSTMAIVGVVFLLRQNAGLFGISLLVLMGYAATIALFMRPIRNISLKAMSCNATVASYMKESIDGILTVKSHGAEQRVKTSIKKHIDSFVRKNAKAIVLSAKEDAASQFIAAAGVLAILWSGFHQVQSGAMTAGELLTFYAMMGYFLVPVRNLMQLQTKLQAAIVATDRLSDIMELQPEQESGASEDVADLYVPVRMSDVDFRYGHRAMSLRGINLEIMPGERILVIGENGCGKTTLTKLLMALHYPVRGELYYGDKEITAIPKSSLRAKIAYVPQDAFLFSDSVLGNLLLGNSTATREDAVSVCMSCRAHDFIQELPSGYDTILGENAFDLSGGQRQRLAIARALLRRPDLLILDEATSNLDSVTEKAIYDTILNMNDKLTLVVIAHSLRLAAGFDRILVINNGMLVEEGPHDELMAKGNLYAAYYNSSTVGGVS